MKRGVFLDGRLCLSPTVKRFMIVLFGGVGYGLIELLWRGYTHPSMVLTGGICFAVIWGINAVWRERPILWRCGVSALIITGVEFCVGMLVNRLWHMDVWDYSGERFNLLGQICLKYTLLWFMLSLPLSMAVSRLIANGRGGK